MEINSIPPVTLERSAVSNVIHANAEARVQQEFSALPVPPVTEVETQTHGNDTSVEHTVEWLPENRGPIYRVVERDSGAVISQVPSEEVLNVARHIDEELRSGTHASIDVRS